MVEQEGFGCPDLDPNWPDMFGNPRGPVVCVLFPDCECGRRLAKEQPHFDAVWVTEPMLLDYTCGCGIYVHPLKHNLKAIHIADCPYVNSITKDKEDHRCGKK